MLNYLYWLQLIDLRITSKLCLSKKQHISCGKIGKKLSHFWYNMLIKRVFLCGLEWNEKESNKAFSVFFFLSQNCSFIPAVVNSVHYWLKITRLKSLSVRLAKKRRGERGRIKRLGYATADGWLTSQHTGKRHCDSADVQLEVCV